MHITTVTLKSGEVIRGYIWTWRSREGWFELVGHVEPIRILLRDVESAFTENERINRNTIGTQDELARAREDGWDGT